MMWRTIILLFLALPLSGQQGMLLVGGGEVELGDLLLDSFPGAVVAYSLRQLDRDYTGDCIRVHRAPEGSQLDIGFLASGTLDTASINTFCAGYTCHVVTWYDQSGNGNDATRAITNIPVIYLSGAILRQNGLPAIRFIKSGKDDLRTAIIGTLAADSTSSHFSVSSSLSTGTIGGVFSNAPTSGDRLVVYQDSRTTPSRNLIVSSSGSYTADLSAARVNTDLRLLSSFKIGSTGAISGYDNGATGGTDTFSGSYTNSNLVIGNDLAIGGTGGLELDGYIMEVIIYRGDQSANRTAIENNINNYYSIY